MTRLPGRPMRPSRASSTSRSSTYYRGYGTVLITAAMIRLTTGSGAEQGWEVVGPLLSQFEPVRSGFELGESESERNRKGECREGE